MTDALYELVVQKWDYVLTVLMILTGLYGMLLKGNLIKKLIGMNIFQAAVILFFIVHAYKFGATVPVYDEAIGTTAERYINPIPHGLMLTAIVVGVATTGVAFALLISIHRRYGTLDEAELLEQVRGEPG